MANLYNLFDIYIYIMAKSVLILCKKVTTATTSTDKGGEHVSVGMVVLSL
jgi:hypothetical protein